MFRSNSPRLNEIDAAFGKGSAVIIIGAHLKDLSEKVSPYGRLTTEQIEDFARTILAVYPQLRLLELMKFFIEFKGGRYGRLFNVSSIAEGLNDFMKYRDAVISELIAEEEKQAKIKSDAEHDAIAITHEEYLRRCEARGIDPYKPYDP